MMAVLTLGSKNYSNRVWLITQSQKGLALLYALLFVKLLGKMCFEDFNTAVSTEAFKLLRR